MSTFLYLGYLKYTLKIEQDICFKKKNQIAKFDNFNVKI